MGGSKWVKAKLGLALKLNSCLLAPGMIEDSSTRFSEAALLSQPAVTRDSEHSSVAATPTTSSSGKSCETMCAICLVTMKPGHGHAIFTAECSHSFHFRCIASNVKHGRQSCPVCRTKWKEVPFTEGGNVVTAPRPQNADFFPRVGRRPPARGDTRHASSLLQAPDRDVYDDDDEILLSEESGAIQGNSSLYDGSVGALEIETYPEVYAVPKSKSHENFLVLIHLKAPPAVDNAGFSLARKNSLAPVDLVTVLDISGSMSGSKLVLLKRAMGFVIQNLGSSDRLSVIVFSSTARRLFPLRRMTDSGKELALQAVNSLSSNGGTNISEGLHKGVKVMTDRKWKNAVSSMILLSDGQDSYNTIRGNTRSDYMSLLPISMHRDSPSGVRIPVHTFGFGADHDAVSMHSISEETGGTFSFIEAENVMQDAFAQCLGGLMTVVVQDVKLELECVHPNLRLGSIKSGSYKTVLLSDHRKASVEVGDLYADEERHFLAETNVPIDESVDEMSLLKIRCSYKNPISKNSVTQDSANEVRIQRLVSMSEAPTVSIPVDKQRNRVRSAEAMAEAKASADRGDLASATTILENCRNQLSETVSAKAGDELILALISELRETQQRMTSRQVYETSGRAYVLSGLSSHSWQRTTARGQSTEASGCSVGNLYQTPSMVDMVTLSQTMSFGDALPRPRNRPPLSSARNCPR